VSFACNGCAICLQSSTMPMNVMMPKAKTIEPANAGGWFVYILRCADDSLYTGATTDVQRRSKQHNAGTASRYIRSRRPVRVAFQEPHASQSSALRREAGIKAMTRTEKQSLIRERFRPGR